MRGGCKFTTGTYAQEFDRLVHMRKRTVALYNSRTSVFAHMRHGVLTDGVVAP